LTYVPGTRRKDGVLSFDGDPPTMVTVRIASPASQPASPQLDANLIQPCRRPSAGTVKRKRNCRDRATALIEDIWCEKIRGCSYTGGNAVLLLNVRYTPIATGIAHAAK
jgi:hypothetical protein